MTNIEKQLKKIEKAIKNGENPEKFKKLLDKILDTELEKRDRKLEAEWERKNRGQDRREEE